MSSRSIRVTTRLLNLACDGEQGACEELQAALVAELRSRAETRLEDGHTTAAEVLASLVNDAFDELVPRKMQVKCRRTFLAAAGRGMRCLRVESARHRSSGGERGQSTLGPIDMLFAHDDPGEVLLLDEALGRLEAIDPITTEIVHLHTFASLSFDDTGHAVVMSPMLVEGRWALGRAWLHRELQKPT